MKEDEIQRMAAETLDIASQVAPVPAPPRLKADVMRSISATSQPVMRPQWLRPALSVAAAVLVLAVNLVTIRHFIQTRSSTTGIGDPIDQVQSEYAQYNADF